tara:strand:+ start:2233 stop:4260 length:2028 start_codon:yes stop_codon:yes gene_type:complete
MGNDFDLIYFSYKRYIAEMLTEGIIPLWSPVNGTGFSLVYNPFAQYFYFPGWILYVVHFITNNLTLHNYLIYTIFAISIFSLGIFNWLKSFKISQTHAFISALIVACSLKVTELLRFPNAAHAAAWIPWVLYGVNLMIKDNKKKPFLIIFFSNLFILTAGYPYIIIYSLFLFFPYILFIPFVIGNYDLIKFNYKIFYFYLLIFLSFLFSYLLALPWLLNVKNFLTNLVDRTEKNWNFSTDHTFYWKDTLGSWIFPSASSTEGWYYPGLIVTMIIFLGLMIFFFNQKKINTFDKRLIFYSIIFIIFISYFSWGKNSYLFIWSWNNLPIIDSLRTWPRINIIIVPFIILLFSISLKYLISSITIKKKNEIPKIIKLLILLFLTIIVIQFSFNYFNLQNEEYWGFWQKKRFDAAIEFLPTIFGAILKLYDGPIYLIFSFISFGYLFFFLKNKKNQNKLNLFYIGILSIVASELFTISNLQWSLPEWKTRISKVENPLLQLQNGFLSQRIIDTVKGNEYFRDNRLFNVNYPDNYGYNGHAKNFTEYFQRYEGRKKPNISDEDLSLVKFFYGATDEAKKFFLSTSINHENVVSFIKDSKKFEEISISKTEIVIKEYTGDKIILNIYSKNDGWLSLIDNWDYGWVATVNEKNMPIYKLLDAYKSVKIKKGFSNVKFQYKPW